MVFSDRTYSVLLLSASEVFNRAVLPLLPSSRFYPVTLVTDLRAANDCAPCDLVIVNAPLPGGDSLSYCSGLSEASDSAILLLVPRDQLEHAEDRMLPYGVMTLGKPLSSGLLTQSLRALCSMRERLRSREQKQQTVEQTIEEIKLINRAKWLLITCLNMTEDEAHRYISKLAMQQKRQKREIAESIIRTYSQ